MAGHGIALNNEAQDQPGGLRFRQTDDSALMFTNIFDSL